MAKQETGSSTRPKQGSPLSYLLAFVSALFIGILIFAYVVTKRAHPVYVDQNGTPTEQQNSGARAQR